MAYVSTDTTRRVRAELKQAYPNLKFSVSKKDGTLRVRIMSGDIDFRDVWEDIPQSKQYWKRFNYPKPHFEGYVDINTYHSDSYNPKYTDLFKGIIDIMKGDEWFDKSEPQIDYFNTAYYMKLSVGKWNKDYQYTGVPRMSDLFGRMRAEEDNNFRVESHTDRIARLQKQIEDSQDEIDKVRYCNHQEWESINKNIGWIDENSFSLTIKCSNCGSHGVAEWEKPTFISWDRTYMAEELEAETKMHPDWCSNCGMKDDGCINLGYGDWYCMNFLNNRETYDGRYDKFKGEEEDMNLLNTYFEEEVYRLSPDIYAEVKDRIDYNSKQLGNNPSHQDRLKQFQSRVRRIDENIYQRAMESAQNKMTMGAEDFEYEDAIGYCGVCNSPYDFNGVEESCGVMCRNCPKELTDGPNWKLSVISNPLHAKYHFHNLKGEGDYCYYETNCQKCDSEPVAVLAFDENAYWQGEPDYFCSSCWNNMKGDETEFYGKIAIHPSKRNNIKNKNLIAKKLLNAEDEDMSLKDSAKLGFGLGAGLLGFRVALFGVSALVGGFILNRNK